MNSHSRRMSCMRFRCNSAHNVSQQPGVLGVDGAVFVTFIDTIHSPKGLREKDPGYVGKGDN